MEKILAALENLHLAILRVEIQLAMNNLVDATEKEICELRYALERANREVMKLENVALVKLYRIAVLPALSEEIDATQEDDLNQ